MLFKHSKTTTLLRSNNKMPMIKIAVASGKGGTGKTMVATSLATALAPTFEINFIDCDVEAPNGHLFLNPQITQTQPAVTLIPEINQDECIACGKCVNVCMFNALAMLQDKVLVFPQLCHGCGSCKLVCPVNAITEKPNPIGVISQGLVNSKINFFMGELTISEPMPTPIIRQTKKLASDRTGITILDSPPGASCSVVATIHDADYVILVTEPTPFGLHDLKQMIGVLSETGSPAGVIINRDGIGDNSVETFLENQPYPILMKIPYQSEIAHGLAAGKVLVDFMPEYQQNFSDLFTQIMDNLDIKGDETC
jgi:MinD superfamily P-loop ATPase